jgi:hypothetical protein
LRLYTIVAPPIPGIGTLQGITPHQEAIRFAIKPLKIMLKGKM